MRESDGDVKKRLVFYIPGYDPRGARHYHGIFRREAKKYSVRTGKEIRVSSRKRISRYRQCWNITCEEENHTVTTDYCILGWDDLIRQRWSQRPFSLLQDIGVFFRHYILTGAFLKYLKKTPNQYVTFFYPLIYFLLIFLSVIFIYDIISSIDVLNHSHWIIEIAALIFAFLIMVLLWVVGKKIAVYWLLSIYAFSARFAMRPDPELQERIDLFARSVVEGLKKCEKGEVDEVLLVSHSVGTILSIPVVWNVLKRFESIPGNNSCCFGVLTLGECIPLVSGLPQAEEYRKMMEDLAASKEMVWLDFTSSIDGACFPLLDFFEDAHAQKKKAENFKFISPRFHKIYRKEHYKKIKKNKYRAHFLYLEAPEEPGGYDYIAMTTGPKTLCQTFFKGRQ